MTKGFGPLSVEHGRPVSVEKTVEVLVTGAEVTWAEMAGATARAASTVGILMALLSRNRASGRKSRRSECRLLDDEY